MNATHFKTPMHVRFNLHKHIYPKVYLPKSLYCESTMGAGQVDLEDALHSNPYQYLYPMDLNLYCVIALCRIRILLDPTDSKYAYICLIN